MFILSPRDVQLASETRNHLTYRNWNFIRRANFSVERATQAVHTCRTYLDQNVRSIVIQGEQGYSVWTGID
ncbi:hypothetical protein [Leptolyngbya sp. FACHB-261]|uniref:hypothetical protein n=1 Tax=Leptolyngbya sp. FACHB-261 TaxID=2692806 RepID=UPI0016842276|nr:hypothetical protein [Leptolyngbya sp. FACHB-261]MBD2104804.1 hypothetical protein [Leptolyngbya sp. FACHB-261]